VDEAVMTLLREDRLALLLARGMNVPMSVDEAASADDIPEPDDPDVVAEDGTIRMDVLLGKLLSALGVDVPSAESELEWKQGLVQAALAKVQEIARSGQDAGRIKSYNRPDNRGATTNPLIDRVGGQGAGGELGPTYMAMALDPLRRQYEQLKMEKHAAAIALAMAPVPALSPEAEAALVDSMSRRMGCSDPSLYSVSASDERLADLLVSRMPPGTTR
jgi:hypothetical protein